MVDVSVLLYPVSFVLEEGPPRLVTLCERGGGTPTASAEEAVDATAHSLLREVLSDLGADLDQDSDEAFRVDMLALCSRFVTLAGTHLERNSVQLIYTATVPVPLAERYLDVIAGSSHDWRTINQSRRRGKTRTEPERRQGPDTIVLDFWRQLFEETDMALDFLPEYLSLHQLRSLYDAVWGYSQDPSGFKRWAVDRRGAFRELLDEVGDAASVETEFYSALGSRLPADQAARAGALAGGDLGKAAGSSLALPLGMTAAVTSNRLVRHRGPEPTWFRKSDSWHQGPTWIENVYPPRPSWTRWDTHPVAQR